jgi:hypothetical protein
MSRTRGIEEEKSNEAVVEENVHDPDKTSMENAKDHKEQVAAHVDVGDLGAAPALCAAGEKDDAGAEEHGEKTTHLAFEEHPLNEEEGKVDVDVKPSESINWKSNGYVMDYFGVAKEIDVHDENTQKSYAAQDIDAGDAVGADVRRGCCHNLSRH